ncbi:hypothetical protein N7537_001807 [Penicillium hordei]|uniref:Peptidase A1 domain-containing protein n=1 Tax=Penicillium hordei TaxID=40994 RepID=A0AAD6H796_9EURO|nr:uncharacterized protein N7537_001807 [Penicillium hordei]KAJ5616693.1 hypothetical protein N7537_001807 [Penicillium hordei]
MRSGSWLFALLGVSLADALSLEKREMPAVFNVPLKHKKAAKYVANTQLRRDNTVLLPIGNDENIIYTNISLGTPPQRIEAAFWMVGNECWVPVGTSHDCATFRGNKNCNGSGGYNKTLSTSMNDLHSNFTVSKSIESSMTITGEFVIDTLVIGDTTVESMKIGILNVDATQNIIGLGYGETNSSFISLTETLVNAGTIKSPAFSMYMENPLHSISAEVSQDEKAGALLFGGVNRSKYNGTLHTLPIVNNPADYRKAFRVNMTSFSINGTSVFPEGPTTQALLDPSLSYTYVPESIAQDIFSQLGATETPTSGPASIPCNIISSDTTLTFEFGAASFKLGIDLFIERRSVFNDEDICYLGIAAKTDTEDANCVRLGANFLQQIYTVYDMGNDEISLAQRNWNSNEDEILEITTGKNAVPGTTLEKGEADDTEARDAHEEKSTGSSIDKGVGLRLSLSIFVIWALSRL